MVAPYANAPAGTTGTGDIMPVTNTIENLNRDFRRRTKTQTSFGTEAAAHGHKQWPSFLLKEWQKVA
jgi:transposase-like protein